MNIQSESVWFEEVDTAFIKYIQNIIKLPNKMGEVVPVPVKIRKADEDFKIEEYPCITLYNLYSKRDEVRYCPEPIVVDRDEKNHKLIEEKCAVPYSLYYQIDFWARLQSQMNAMTRLWIGHHPDRCFNLNVTDTSGKPRDSFVLMTEDLKKSDTLSNSQRTFHSTLTYRVWVEIDERLRVEKDMVTSVPYPKTKKL